MKRGGHDLRKLYAAYAEAKNHKGKPTAILAKTKKGYGMGRSGESRMTSHQQKKLDETALKAFRDRFHLPLSEEELEAHAFYKPKADSPEMVYLNQRREALGGAITASWRKPVSRESKDRFIAALLGWTGLMRWCGSGCIDCIRPPVTRGLKTIERSTRTVIPS